MSRKMFITPVAILALGLGSTAMAFAKHGSSRGGYSARHADRGEYRQAAPLTGVRVNRECRSFTAQAAFDKVALSGAPPFSKCKSSASLEYDFF